MAPALMNVSNCSLIVVSLTLRTFCNLRPLLEQLRAEGWDVKIVWTPSRFQPGGQSPRDLGFDIALETDWRLQSPDQPYRSLPPGDSFWIRFLNLVEDSDPVCILCDDATNWPSMGVHQASQKLNCRPFLLAAQHGLSQPWHALNRTFHFDFFLAFGPQYVFMFDRGHWKNVLPTGLPKLDSVSEKQASQGEYLLYVAQHFPNPAIVADMLEGLRERGFHDVRIRPHPGHPRIYEELQQRFKIENILTDSTELILRSNAVIMPHSTAVLEAILLRKKVAVIPSAGLIDFPLLPWVARDYTAMEIEKAFVQAGSKKREAEYDRFLERVCGGRLFQSVNITKKFIYLLAAHVHANRKFSSRFLDFLWNDAEGKQLLEEMKHPFASVN